MGDSSLPAPLAPATLRENLGITNNVNIKSSLEAAALQIQVAAGAQPEPAEFEAPRRETRVYFQ